jgi:hypothetical protein
VPTPGAPEPAPACPALPQAKPIDPSLHPIETGNYRIATPAIQLFYELICRCLRYRITGALAYGLPRIGKTRAIEYLRLLLSETHPKVTTFHAQAEHKPRHAEGPFFSNLLQAVGFPEPDSGSNPTKRLRLITKIKEACARKGSGTVILFCDEAQRYDENEYEWLRDVHDHLDRIQIRLFTFLVGQEELLSVKATLQQAHKTQIVARLMVDELVFRGVRDVTEVATCLSSYDKTSYPRASDWSLTRFYLPLAKANGYLLSSDAAFLWNAFAGLHHKHGLPGALEIPMESFAWAVKIVLKEGGLRDASNFRPDAAMWNLAVRSCDYVQARQTVSTELLAARP